MAKCGYECQNVKATYFASTSVRTVTKPHFFPDMHIPPFVSLISRHAFPFRILPASLLPTAPLPRSTNIAAGHSAPPISSEEAGVITLPSPKRPNNLAAVINP